MNIFGKLFGGRKKRPKVLLHEAIKKLRITEDLLIKRQAFLEQKIKLEIVNARKYGTKNKSLALYALKRKKQYEKQLNQIDGTLSTIEFQREALENASTNSEVLNAMSSAAIALKTAHKHTNVNQVHDLMEDIVEHHEIANEITDVLSNSIGFGREINDDELMKELEQLEQLKLDEKLFYVKSAPMTELPATKVSKSKKQQDYDELVKLKSWIAC